MKMDDALKFLPPGVFLLASGVALWQSRSFPEVTGGVPGPALVPSLLAIVLGIIGIFLLFKAWREVSAGQPRGEGEEASPHIPWGRFGAMLLLIVAYLVLMPRLGFISTTVLFLVASLYCFGYRGGVQAWAFGFAAAFILYGVFAKIMNVPLPAGWLG